MATHQYFLKIDGVEGESEDPRHKQEMEVETFSWGESNPQQGRGGAGGGGRVVMQDFHFTTRTSKASPKLFLACASGQHFARAVFSVCSVGGSPGERVPRDFLTWVLSDVLIVSYETRAEIDSSLKPVEEVALRYGKIQVAYIPATGSQVNAGWDLGQNKAA